MDLQALTLLLFVGIIMLVIVVSWLISGLKQQISALPLSLQGEQEMRHRAMLTDLAEGLARQGDRIAANQTDAADRIRQHLSQIQLEQTHSLAANRETLIRELSAMTQETIKRQELLKTEMLGVTLERLAEQSRAQQETLQSSLRDVMARVTGAIESLTKANDTRLAEISGKVNERLDEGFKKTNETFINVMARLATIDEAQKKIDGLTTNMVSLQQLLGDKRSRGAFGEMQLETIIRNVLPESIFEFQYTFSTKVRVDCVLKLPDPTGMVAIDSKFPLENYERMFAEGPERATPAAFKVDVRKHIDDISSKYIIPGETSDGAMMFLPAEAVFAEIHAHHRDLVEYAGRKRVWIVSPTTLMAVLNTALAVIKDVETRKQVHVIKDALNKLGGDFGRFQSRMDDLARHIGQVSKDVELVHTSSRKITEQFQKIEKAEIDVPALTPTESKPQLSIVKPVDS